MPAFFAALLGLFKKAVFVEFFGLLGGDDGDLVVFAAEGAAGVGDGVDVQFGGAGFAGELAELLGEGFLELVSEVVLFAEEDDAALGDCVVLVLDV